MPTTQHTSFTTRMVQQQARLSGPTTVAGLLQLAGDLEAGSDYYWVHVSAERLRLLAAELEQGAGANAANGPGVSEQTYRNAVDANQALYTLLEEERARHATELAALQESAESLRSELAARARATATSVDAPQPVKFQFVMKGTPEAVGGVCVSVETAMLLAAECCADDDDPEPGYAAAP